MEELKKENRKNYIIYANYTNPHPNPYFYKYYYRIFTENSTCEYQEFLKADNIMNTAEALKFIKYCDENKIYALVYNFSKRRFDPANTPFKWNFNTFNKDDWAPPFDQDTDEEFNGHK